MLKKKQIEIVVYNEKETLVISKEKYTNGRICLLLTTELGEPFCKLTTNIPEIDIKENQFFIKEAYPERYIAEQLEKKGLIKRMNKFIDCAYHQNYAMLWEIVTDV